jgi:hypothetical protein
MSELLIQFDSSLGSWSPFVYWFVVVNTILCGVFTLVVIVGGAFDLRFLFNALNEDVGDEADDGRVVAQEPGKMESTGG